MERLHVDGVLIDPASRVMLRALLDAPEHRANTSELNDRLGERDFDLSNDSVRYRMKKLEDAGLVTIDDPGIDDHGRRLPLVAELTERGVSVADDLDAPDPDVADLEERVDDLEDDLSKFRDVYTRQIRGTGGYKGVLPAVKELEERVEALEEQVDTDS